MKTLFAILSIGVIATALTAQTVPPLVNYQGKLSNPDGSALPTADYTLTFKIYNSASNGTPMWGPQIFDGAQAMGHGGVIPVVQGYFNVMLGPVDVSNISLANAFNGTNCFVEITVGTNSPIAPRQQILTTPFAFQAAYAGQAGLASNVVSGIAITNPVIANAVISGNGSGLTNLNGGSLQHGTVGSQELANSSITINPGAGLAGGGTVALGSAITLSNTGVLSVTGNSDVTANNTAGAVTLGTTATSTNTSGTIVKRDASGNFAAGTITCTTLNSSTVSASNLTVNGTLTFPSTPVIFAGASTLIQLNPYLNFFAGSGAGNLGNSNILYNTGVGTSVLEANTGVANSAFGAQAMISNTTGSFNTAVGFRSLSDNLTGSNNVAIGWSALLTSTSASENTAVGYYALSDNTSGYQNTAMGEYALPDNTIGSQNTAVGVLALGGNTNGSQNTAIGVSALHNNASGTQNIGVGFNAGQNVTTGSNNIEIGNVGNVNDNGTIYVGTQGIQTNTLIAGVSGTAITSGLPVYVNSSGQLGNQTLKQVGTNVSIGGIAVSASCGLWTNSTGEAMTVSNFNLTVTTQGNPVEVTFVADGTTNGANGIFAYFYVEGNTGQVLDVALFRDGVNVGIEESLFYNTGDENCEIPPGAYRFLDLAPPGIHNYQVQMHGLDGADNRAQYMRMVVREL